MEVVVLTTRATAVMAVLACLVLLAAPAFARAADDQEVASVKHDLVGRVAPKFSARGLTHVWPNTGFSNRRAIYPVLERRAVGNSEWLRISVIRNRKQVGAWVPASITRTKFINWRVTIDLSGRRATITRAGSVVRRFRVVVGAPGTPTPRGRFYVVDHMRLHNSWAGGNWALALSAFSNVLKNFDGGKGQVAMHAKGALSNPLGSAASHGCVRFANDAAAWMARKVPNGSRVDIHA
jgi:lipoprotein-anchoring transpeptidase ErfK/SrfK